MAVNDCRLEITHPHPALTGQPLDPAPLAGLRDALTVEAWVYARRTGGEAVQPLVSQWSHIAKLEHFAAFDAGRTDGLVSAGYFGAVFDGRYVYFSPEHSEDLDTHGIVLRLDTHGDFKSPKTFTAYDAGKTAGLDTRGYYGAAFDGRYVYFVPRQLAMVSYHTHLLRYDTRGDFKNPASWDAHNIGIQQSNQSCAFDGRYLYLCPGYSDKPTTEGARASRVIRIDTRAEFHNPSSYRDVDIAKILGPRAAGFDGATFDGRFIYLTPLENGVPVRYDTTQPFDAAASWESFDAATMGMEMNVGSVFDGRFIYYVAYKSARIFRYDTLRSFGERDAWARFDSTSIGGLRTEGFDGGFFDGRRVHLIPFVRDDDGPAGYALHGNWLSYDPSLPFTDRSSWASANADHIDGMPTIGFNGGAFDGRYMYAAPWRSLAGRVAGEIGVNGRVLRVDTLREGAFSLRYSDCGHNGGLCAAVTGPTFIVNTTTGARFVAANRVLTPGWHHLVGTYGNGAISLFIDGQLAATRSAIGAIQACKSPLMIGRFESGPAVFDGVVEKIAVHDTVREPA